MIDRAEAVKRGVKTKKHPTSHPYAGIEHRVIDSDAFANLKNSAVRLLLLLSRQLNGRNNGQLQATYSFMSKRGIGSEHTLKDAISDLISHGFIYRTRSHGANGAWARYAVTWLPIQDKDGLFLAGFEACAWRHWQASEKKAPRKNRSPLPAEIAVSTAAILQNVQECTPQNLQTMNSMPCTSLKAPLIQTWTGKLHRQIDHNNSPRSVNSFSPRSLGIDT